MCFELTAPRFTIPQQSRLDEKCFCYVDGHVVTSLTTGNVSPKVILALNIP